MIQCLAVRLCYNRFHFVQYKSIMPNTDLFIPSFQSYYNSIDSKKQQLLDYLLCFTPFCPYEHLENVLSTVTDRNTRYRLIHGFAGEESMRYVPQGAFDMSDCLHLDAIFECDVLEVADRLMLWLNANSIFNNASKQHAYGRYNGKCKRDQYVTCCIRCGFT